MCANFIWNLKGHIFGFFFFNNNLLILSHSIIFKNSSFTADSVLLFGMLSLKDLMVLNKVVSMAYIIKLNILLSFG